MMTCFLSCCRINRTYFHGESQFTEKVEEAHERFVEMRTTAIALVIIALLFSGGGLVLMGIGTMPSTMAIGYGVFPYLIGSQLAILGGMILLPACVFAAFAAHFVARARHGNRLHDQSQNSRASVMFPARRFSMIT